MLIFLCAIPQFQKDVLCPEAKFPRLTHSQTTRACRELEQGTQSIFWVLLGHPTGRVGRLGVAVGPRGAAGVSQSMTAPRRAQAGGETKVGGMLSPKVFSGFSEFYVSEFHLSLPYVPEFLDFL